jgi:NADPH:quinone reductase-like Zn-dependent oxidoreductase
MGVISFGDKTVPMGAELAGRVRRIGSNVRNVALNDRVLAVECSGCFTTNAVIFAPLVTKIPDDLSYEDAATIPGCFTTVIHALIDIGQLEKGQVSLSL